VEHCPDHSQLINMVRDIHSALISGVDGKRGIVERVRVLETSHSTINKWSGIVIGAGITSVVSCIVGAVFLFLRNP